MTKFDVKAWTERCKTCRHARVRSSTFIECKLPRGTACNYELRFDELKITPEESDRTKRESQAIKYKKRTETGKVCPCCNVFYEFDMLRHYTIKGKVYYSYCKACFAEKQNAYKRRIYREQAIKKAMENEKK